MATGKAVISVIGFLLVVASAIYFGWRFIGSTDEILEQPDEDAYYASYGCYESDGGTMYTCPNGAPPDPDANPEYFAQWKESQ
jgi:hypothetical protein